MIGIHLVACPKPQSRGAKSILVFFVVGLLIFERDAKTGYFFLYKIVKLVRLKAMQTYRRILILLLLFSSIVIISCNSGRGIGGSSKKCGCGINAGMSGYK